jgi:hypothetical protein
MDEKGYRIFDSDMRVGQSDLTGSAVLDTTGAKPDLNIGLTAKILNITALPFPYRGIDFPSYQTYVYFKLYKSNDICRP